MVAFTKGVAKASNALMGEPSCAVPSGDPTSYAVEGDYRQRKEFAGCRQMPSGTVRLEHTISASGSSAQVFSTILHTPMHWGGPVCWQTPKGLRFGVHLHSTFCGSRL